MLRTWVRLLCSTLLVAAGGHAAAAVTSGVAGGILSVSSDGGDAITVSCPAGNVLINGSAPDTGVVTCAAITELVITGGNAANTIDIGAVTVAAFPNLTSRSISAFGGDDIITGSPSADVVNGGLGVDLFLGGDGNDTFTGGDGNDIALLGAGDDVALWNPGDDNDTIEGQAGTDTLLFNGANVAESYTISPNGGRLVLFRNVANVTMDLDDVEQIEIRALGGADIVTVADTAGTDLLQLRVDLAATGGVGDAQADNVTVNGVTGTDAFTLVPISGGLALGSGARSVQVVNGDVALDTLTVNGLDGNDTFTAGVAAVGVLGATFDGGVGNDVATLEGSASGDTIQATASAGVISLGTPDGTVFATLGVESVVINAQGGNDTISNLGIGSLAQLTIDGGPGDDVINGGLGNEVLLGGDGNDTVRGGDGNDLALLGAGDDVFVWNPGDDNDTVEGQSGEDTLAFNGSNVGETINLLASGGRALLARNVASVTMDLDDVERVELALLGGADGVGVADLSGTDLTQVQLDLRGSGGGGDAGIDSITVSGSGTADVISVAAAGPDVLVNLPVLQVSLIGPEAANDTLVVQGGAGDDALLASIAASALARLTLDGGANVDGDLAVVVGDASAETYAISPLGADARVDRTSPSVAGIDILGVERLQLDALGGADAVTTAFLASTVQSLDGGDPAAFPGDSLVVAGFTGDIARPPLNLPGFASIEHARFELGLFDAFLTGRQVVSPTDSTGNGHARLSLQGSGDTIDVALNFQDLVGTNTENVIRGPAPRGANAPGAALFVLPGTGASSGSVEAIALPISAEQRTQLENGLLYIEVQTDAFPDGEIRGQFDDRVFIDGFE